MEERLVTRDETINILMTIQAAYPSFKVPDKTIAVNTWHSILSEYQYSQVGAALKKYIQTNKSGFAPSIGQIIDSISEIYSKNDKNEIEAWNIVWKAIRSSGDYNRALVNFENFPQVIKKSVGSPGQLKEWALTENLNVEVVSSNFMRTYRMVLSEEKERRKMSPEILKIIEDNIKKPVQEEPLREISVSQEREFAMKNAVQMPDRVREKLKGLI